MIADLAPLKVELCGIAEKDGVWASYRYLQLGGLWEHASDVDCARMLVLGMRVA